MTTFFPLKDSLFRCNMFCAKYTVPYPVASGLISDPPHEAPFPVKTPVKVLFSFLYIPNINPISLAPTPMSPAGTSVLCPICRYSSVIKAWQKRMISLSDFPLGSKSDPPFPPPIGRVVSEFLNTCSKAKNFKILAFTEG